MLSRGLCICRAGDRFATANSFQCDGTSDGGLDSATATGSAARRSRYKFLLHDRHKTFSLGLDEEVARWGIDVLKNPAHAPTANAFCERLIRKHPARVFGLCDTAE